MKKLHNIPLTNTYQLRIGAPDPDYLWPETICDQQMSQCEFMYVCTLEIAHPMPHIAYGGGQVLCFDPENPNYRHTHEKGARIESHYLGI